MLINVSWYDEAKTIILQELPKIWNWDDFFKAVETTVAMEKTVKHPVYVITTQAPKTSSPSGNIIAQYEKAIMMHHENFRFLIVASENYVASAFIGIWLKTTKLRGRVYMLNTFQDALRLITEDKAKQKV